MRQTASDFKQAVTAQAGNSSEPVGAVGVDCSDGLMRAATYLMRVTVTGTGTIQVGVRGRDREDVWGIAGEGDGLVNLGAALAAGKTYFFFVRDAGVFKRLMAVTQGATGSPVTNVWFAAVYERGD